MKYIKNVNRIFPRNIPGMLMEYFMLLKITWTKILMEVFFSNFLHLILNIFENLNLINEYTCIVLMKFSVYHIKIKTENFPSHLYRATKTIIM